MALDPFQPTRLVLAASGAAIFVVDDIAEARPQDDKGRKYTVGDAAKGE